MTETTETNEKEHHGTEGRIILAASHLLAAAGQLVCCSSVDAEVATNMEALARDLLACRVELSAGGDIPDLPSTPTARLTTKAALMNAAGHLMFSGRIPAARALVEDWLFYPFPPQTK